MTFPSSHKTVIIMDCCKEFTGLSKEPVMFDVSNRYRVPGFIPMSPIQKTMWTCNVEAVLEFSRITYDIFPSDKLIQLIVSGEKTHSVNNWTDKQQSLTYLMESMAHANTTVSACTQEGVSSAEEGLKHAITALSQLTTKQQQLVSESGGADVVNRGIIILITSIHSEGHIQSLEDHVLECLLQNNKKIMDADKVPSPGNPTTMLPIQQCNLVLVDVVPVDGRSAVTARPNTDIGSILSSEVHTSLSGHNIAASMIQLAIAKYSLASTTVTGIPMKEEQNASSSANYDVELLHSAKAHAEILKSADVEGLMVPSKEGLYTQAVMLKWCTPKSSVVELHQCNETFRISPVDVNSRPSSCLTNFLLSGRSVMLEQPRKSGGKIMSHMLASHGGELYLHTLMATRSCLEDPPSISEGSGGRVTDYRITNFGELMKENRLAPAAVVPGNAHSHLSRSISQLERITRCWPLTISENILFTLQGTVDSLLTYLPREVLSDLEVQDCKSSVYKLVAMESRNELLSATSQTGSRGKGPKREDQYRQLWSEVDRFVRAHSTTSDQHYKVLECVVECKRSAENTSLDTGVSDKQWAELHKIQPSGGTQRNKTAASRDTALPARPPKVPKLSNIVPMKNKTHGGKSLLDLWTQRVNTQLAVKKREFSGRLETTSNVAQLYKHLELDSPAEPPDMDGQKKKP